MYISKPRIRTIQGTILIVLLNVLFPIGIYASNTIDSLKNILNSEIADTVRVQTLTQIGNELILNSHTEALPYYTESKKLAEEINDTTWIVYNIVGLSDTYSLMGEYKMSLKLIQEALEIAEGKNALLALAHGRLAVEYHNLNQQELSFKNDQLALKYSLLINDSIEIAYNYHNIGMYYSTQEYTDSTFHYYNLALQYLSDEDDILYAHLSSSMALAYAENEMYEKSIDYHLKAIDYFIEYESYYDLSLEENYIARNYIYIENIDKALEHANKSLANADSLNNHHLYAESYNLLYYIYNQQKDYKTALKYALLERTYRDSLKTKNRQDYVSSIEAKYKYDEQQSVLKASEDYNSILLKQKTQLITFSTICIVLLIIGIIVIIRRNKEHKKNMELLDKLDHFSKSRARLLSIIGHDLRASLGSLKGFTELMHSNSLDNKTVQKMITSFVPMVDSTHSLLETLLLWTKNNDDNLNLQKEYLYASNITNFTIEHLRHLAEIKNINIIHNESKLAFVADRNMILAVIRNLISNAIRYSENNSNIWISYTIENSNVKFIIKDEGIGMSDEEISMILPSDNPSGKNTSKNKGTGVGLSLCQSFIAKHGGELNINSTKGIGSEVCFTLPTK